MLDRAKTLFTHHPDSVGESYGQHFGVAMSYAGRMAAASVCAFVHAFLPFLFEKTASRMLREMVAEMDARGAHGREPRATVIQPAE
jgi:hypothetical protein